MKTLIALLILSLPAMAQLGNATRIQGRNVAPTAPSDTNTLCWDAAGVKWKPCTASGGATSGGGGASSCVPASASGTTITCAPTPAVTAYTAGMIVVLIPDVNGSGGPTTLNVAGLGAKSIKRADGTTDPLPGDLVTGVSAALTYDGTVFRLPLIYEPPGKGGINVTRYNVSGFRVIHHATNSPAGTSVTFDSLTASQGGVDFTAGMYLHCYGTSASGAPQKKLMSTVTVGTLTVVIASAFTTTATTPTCWTEGDVESSGTNGVGTTAFKVKTNASYLAGQGIAITGAGTAGAVHYTTIASVSGTDTITLVDATITSVADGFLVEHNDNVALTALHAVYKYTGARFYFPGTEAGNYGNLNLYGPVIDAGSTATHCNCIFQMPTLLDPWTGIPAVTFVWEGASVPIFGNGGVVVKGNATGGASLIGGYNTSSTNGKFTNLNFRLKNIVLVSYADPNVIMVDGTNIAGVGLDDVICETGTGLVFTAPTNTANYCIKMPPPVNNTQTLIENVYVYGYYTGIKLSEHSHAQGILDARSNHFGVELSSTQVSTAVAHPIYIDHILIEANTIGINVTTKTVAHIGLISAEFNVTADVAGASNLYGTITCMLLGGANDCTNTGVSHTWDFETGNTTLGPHVAGAPWAMIHTAAAGINSSYQNLSSTGWSGFKMYDSTSTDRGNCGYGNASSGGAIQGKVGCDATGVDVAFGIDGTRYLTVDRTTKSTIINPGTPTVDATSCTGATIGTGARNVAGTITGLPTGACSVVLTFVTTSGVTGWGCGVNDQTTANLFRQTASTTTTATFVGTAVTGDVLRYICQPY